MQESVLLKVTIPENMAGKRLDQVLAEIFKDHSRTRLQTWIRNGHVRVNNKILRQRDHVVGGELVEIKASIETRDSSSPEDIPLHVLHEDSELIILNKPAGLVVHPGAGNPEHTLLNALLHFDPQLEYVPRAGIVQRLDKDTSGLMVVARTPQTHTYFVEQLQARSIKREYKTIVSGVMTAGGSIDQPIGRHPRHRKKMTVTDKGKTAITHYRIIKKFSGHTYLQIQLETGRTHQIRVHLSYLKYPILGDPVYGGRVKIPKNTSMQLISTIQSFPRQALHAYKIELKHPVSGDMICLESPLPEDMQSLFEALENNEKSDQ